MVAALNHDGDSKLTLQISLWVKIAVSVLAASMAVGGGILGHVVQDAHHDQQVDDSIKRLDATVEAIRAEQTLNSEARIRSIEQLAQVKDQLSVMQAILQENRMLLREHDLREKRDHRP